MLVMEEDKAASSFDQYCRFAPTLSVLLGLAWANCACAVPKHFDLPAGDARTTLNQFSQQSDIQLLFDYTQLKGRTTNAVVGNYEPADALNKLVEGLPVRWSMVNDHTMALTVVTAQTPSVLRRSSPVGPRAAAQPAVAAELEQVLVAGSNSLDEPPPLGAALIRLDRVDIERSGVATTQELIETLPQVFGGGPSEDTVLGREAPTNATKGSGINLRGLDAGATLVLIDGQRTAPSGTKGLFADISGIPLSAIDHVEILPDGASAKYGADAIGGVVNFVLRSNFTGAQTQFRDGDFNGNPLGGRLVSQLFGGHFGSSTGMVGFEFYDRGALPAQDRLQATSNLTRFGGSNFDVLYGNPGTISVGPQTFAMPSGGIPRSSTPRLVPGTQNLYDQWSGADVLPDQERWSAFGTLRAEMGDALEFSADSLFTRRRVDGVAGSANPLSMTVSSTSPFYFNPTGGTAPVTVVTGSQTYFGVPYSRETVDTGNVNLGLSWKLTDSWTLSPHVGYTFENEHGAAQGLFDASALAAALSDRNPDTALDPFVDASGNNPATIAGIARTGFFTSRSSLKLFGFDMAGRLFNAPGGRATLALGAEYRVQSFDTTSWSAAASPYPVASPAAIPARSDLRRTVRAQFGELRIPLVGPDNPRTLLQGLEFSFGERAENYSDVGTTVVPKAGFEWWPSADLTIRGTWTRSFRPPVLSELVATNSRSDLVTLRDAASPTGTTTVLFATGNNPNLEDERARTWTLGAQLTPAAFPGLSVALTYFDTYYENRIDSAIVTPLVLNQPQFGWLVTRNFTAAQRAEICNDTAFAGAGDCLTSPIGALIDNRLRNLEYLETRGFDLLARYGFSTSVGRFDIGFNGTYLLGYGEQMLPGGPIQQLLNTQNNPINLRFRSSLSWERAGLGASLFVNFDNSYRDLLSVPSRSVASFTTLDLQLRYQLGSSAPGLLANTEIALTARNLFNSSPPFLNNPVGVGYDEENADLTGRILSVDIRKRW
jgi:iron complex outermembrane recepter protein